MSDQAVGLLTANIASGNILPENILDIDTKSVKCFLCDKNFVTGDESFLLFNDRIQSEGSCSECPLAQILTSALDVEIEESTAHSSLLCSACNDIVLEYERIEQKLFALRLRIITSYSRTTLRLKDVQIINEETDPITLEDNSAGESTMLTEIQENSSELAEEVVEENLDMVANVFDSFEMIGESNEIHDDMKLFSVEGSLNFEDSKGIIIYEESQSVSEPDIPDEENILIDKQGTDSTENAAALATIEVIEINKDTFTIEEQNELFSCSICDDSIYLDAKSFSDHMYSAHKLRVYPCDLCNNAFQRKQDLNEHVTKEHTKELQSIKFECDVCSRIFDTYRIFRAHKRNMHNAGNKYECQECHKKFNCKTSLEEHMNLHYGLRPFECDQCGKKLASKYALHIHTKTHGERERPHKCDECGKSFLTIQNLNHHKKIHSEKVYACTLCQKSFATQHSLDAHSIVHSRERPFLCRTCGKAFARRAEVIDHERIHTGVRPFKCDMCDKTFTQRSNLTAHKKTTHFNEKQHTCEICKRSFKRRRLLDYHTQAVHTGERPYKCDTCTSSFVYPEHYKKHLRIHTGLKPFACEVCEKRFSSRDNRNAHRFVHSDKKPYECLECGTGFMRKPLLLAHMKQSKHVSDTIIVNQPQLTEGKLKTATLTVQSDEASESFIEAIISDFGEGASKKEEEDMNIGESVSLEKILPNAQTDMVESSMKDNSENEYVVHDGDVAAKSDQDDVRYLQFDEFDANHEAISWVDLAGDKN